MTGQGKVVKIFCQGKDLRKLKVTSINESNFSHFKLWKIKDKIYTQCFCTASRIS